MRNTKRGTPRHIRLLLLILSPVVLFVDQPLASAAQPVEVTYTNPLAYVGADNNRYITSLDNTRSTLIALEPAPTEDHPQNVDSAPYWSPQGTQLAFIDIHTYEQK